MKTRHTVALAMLAGVGLGVAAVHGLHAQTKPPVYFIAENEVTDAEAYGKECLPLVRPMIKAHGGRTSRAV